MNPKPPPIVALLCLGLLAACSHSQLAEVRFEYHDHRVLLPVLIEGQGPFHMIFDTGGSNVLDTATAKRLGVKTVPAGFAGGAGDGRMPMFRASGISYSAGAVTMADQEFIVLDLSRIKRAFDFPRLDGVVGYELLKRYGATIDYRRKTLSFHDLERFAPAGTPLPFRLMRRKPVIAGTVGGRKTEFLVDTGDRSSFTLFQKFSGTHGLDEHFEAKVTPSGMGLGGPIPARLGALPELGLGAEPLQVTKVHARLPTTTKDFFARSELGGSVGNGLLQRFVVSFDYRARRMTLAPVRKPKAYRFVPPRPE